MLMLGMSVFGFMFYGDGKVIGKVIVKGWV